jgi:hypothetical protein
LIARRATGFLRHAKEAIHNILVEPDRDPVFALGLSSGGRILPRLPLLKSYRSLVCARIVHTSEADYGAAPSASLRSGPH